MRDTITIEERLSLIHKVLNEATHPSLPEGVRKAAYDVVFELACSGWHSVEWLELVEKECRLNLSYFKGLVDYRERART